MLNHTDTVAIRPQPSTLGRRAASVRPSRRPPPRLGALLCARGLITRPQLHRALADQARLDAPLGEILIATGALSEEALFATLADQHRCTRAVFSDIPPPDDVLSLLPAQTWLAFGAIPLGRGPEGAYIALSDPHQRADLAAALAPVPLARIALAPPQVIAHQISTHLGAPLARRAETRVAAQNSCRTWAQPKPRDRMRMPLAALAALLLVVADPLSAALILTGWCILTLLGATLMKLASLGAMVRGGPGGGPGPAPVPATPLPPSALQSARPSPNRSPKISVLVALHREPKVAARLVKRMTALRYPAVCREIIFVVEADDTITRTALAAAAPLPQGFGVVVVPDGAPRTKPRALNYALDFCRGEIIGVYDAEDAPDPQQLTTIAETFADAPDDVVCLQGVLDYYNPRENWLARCFTMEYASWFRVVLPGLARLRLPVPLGGTTLFFRRSALEKLDGWDAHNVTEDADLGMRLARRGWRTQLVNTTTLEEANCHLWTWIKQRSRWIKGYMVTYLVHMRRPCALMRELGLRQFLAFQVFFLTTISQFLLAPLLWSFWAIPLGFDHPVMTAAGPGAVGALMGLFLFSEAVNIVVALWAVSGPTHRHLIPWVPSMMLYFPLATAAAFKGAYELAARPFYWDKTEHGLSSHQPEDMTPSIAPSDPPPRHQI